jgi:hypothetical protein
MGVDATTAFEGAGAVTGPKTSGGVALWAKIAAGNRNRISRIGLKVLSYRERICSKGEPGPQTDLAIIETKGLE